MFLVPLTLNDTPQIWHFLRLAAHETSLARVHREPQLARYAQNFGRVGDFGVLAREGEMVIGACWARLFPENEPGYGWVSDEIPEISLAVREEYRGRGAGRALLETIIQMATQRRLSLSLSVRLDNVAALRLYQRCGFEEIEGTETLNRTSTTSVTMLWRLR